MSNLDNLLLENEALKTEINTLKQLILDLENENKKSWSTIIDEKVELWYEKFKDDIDIGRISSFNVLGTSFEVDVLPDTMEKAIYKKCIKIIFAMILEMKDNI
jgi:hypothetical protein